MSHGTATMRLQPFARDYIEDVPGVEGLAGSPWLSENAEVYPTLAANRKVDVAVVGAGLVGVLTALHLARAGARVALVERRRIGGGVTGHSTAKVTVQHSLEWQQLRRSHSDETLLPYAAQNAIAPQVLEDIIRSLQIECGFERTSSLVYAVADGDEGALQRELEAYEALGLSGEITHASSPAAPDGAAALVMREQAHMDPAALLLGCVRGLGESALIFEDTAVLDIDERRGGVDLHCSGGLVVQADSVVTATYFPIYDRAGFFSRLFPYRVYALLVETGMPLEHASWLPASGESSLTVRPAGPERDGRWVVSGVHHKAGQGGDERTCYAHLVESARAAFPDAKVVRHWSTQDCRTPDGLPFVGKMPLADRVFFAAGFGGWGMTKGVVSARLLADLVGGRVNAVARHLDPGRMDLARGIGQFASENANTAVHIAGGLRPGASRHGRTQVSRCTHMGCALETNEAEGTWDCPCHGSRFASDGTVVGSPAKADIEITRAD